jgi:RNA polymerase sigma factor (sigma-70 family)
MEQKAWHYEDPDRALLRGMSLGDTRALDALYERHGGALLGFLIARLNDRQAAEEVLQDTMLAAWRAAGTFRGESSIRTWLFVIARNRATNLQRKRQPHLAELDDNLRSDMDTGPLERVERRAVQDAVRAALERLPTQQREVLVLVFYNQFSEREIAQILDISPGTVKSRLHRAKEMLRRVLQQQGGLE